MRKDPLNVVDPAVVRRQRNPGTSAMRTFGLCCPENFVARTSLALLLSLPDSESQRLPRALVL